MTDFLYEGQWNCRKLLDQVPSCHYLAFLQQKYLNRFNIQMRLCENSTRMAYLDVQLPGTRLDEKESKISLTLLLGKKTFLERQSPYY